MSYCRFSSDNFRCDLYCYESCYGGWITHVAGNRIIGDLPSMPTSQEILDDPKRATLQLNAHLNAVRGATREPIGGPCDGETFNDPTLEDFLRRLVSLREMGYRFPDGVLEAVREEIEGE